MIDQIIVLVAIFATIVFGTMTLVMGYRALQKLSRGRIKDYGINVWYALVLFSIGGALHTCQELFHIQNILHVDIIFFEYFFYSAYYVVLLFAIFSLYKMSKFIGFNRKSKEMVEAMNKIKSDEENNSNGR